MAINWEFQREGDTWRVATRTTHAIDGGPRAHELLSHALDSEPRRR